MRSFWKHVGELTSRIDSEHVSIDLTHACDNVLPSYSGVKWVVFLTLLAVAMMVVCTTRMKGILQYERYYHHGLVGFFGHRLKIKIRTDIKYLLSADFNER